MEYRGEFSTDQKRLLGNSLFGCDFCTAACPPANDTATQKVDLEWLLAASNGELKRRLAGTALAYAGPKLLKRNAQAIVEQWEE
jgi:epoxyqueuosine reductase QueG